jgi:hypothetical protein
MFKVLMLIVCVACSAAATAKLAQAVPFQCAQPTESAG